MKTLLKLIVTIAFAITTWSVLAQGMFYQDYGLIGSLIPKTGVKLSNGDYVYCGYDYNNDYAPTIFSTTGWSIPIVPEPGGTEYLPCITSYNDTIYCAFTHNDAITIGGVTYPDPPNGAKRPIALMISSSGNILDSWEISGNSYVWGISAKDGEFAVMGRAYSWPIEHLSYPYLIFGGAYVLINDLTDWDVNKGFAIETEYIPTMHSIQYLTNGNLALAGETAGGDITFGGIILPVDGSTHDDGFRGEITTSGVGINAILIDSYYNTEDNFQITMADGSYMITGRYKYSVSFYQSDGTLDYTLDDGNSIDQIYFASYDSDGNFQTVSCAYNHINEGLQNIDLACNDDSFYSIISNLNGGTVITPTGSHEKQAAVFLKFDVSGNPEWSKQYDGPFPSQWAHCIIDNDIVTIFGRELPTTDLDFNSGTAYLPDYSGFWAEYFDGTVTGPSANFNGAPTSIEEGQSVTFTNASTQGTNPITSWTWTFEGGNPGTYYGQNPPSVVYNTAGTYDVTLVVSDGSLSDTAVKTDYITVNPAIPPTAEFNGTPLNGDAPLNVSFTDLSVAGTNAITSWSWDFGDGGSSSSQNPSHPYNTPGTYTVSLTVSDGSFYDEETKTDYITVTQPAPVANFSGTPLSGDAPLIVNFTDLSANNPDSWSWDFGDGESSSSQNPNHIYDVPGIYSVSLTVSNSGGSDTEIKTDYISVSAAPPKANFSGTPTTGFVPLEVSFTDQSIAGTYAITSREWDFGDGSTSTDQNPSHTYNSAGDYTVSLTVTDGTLEDTETKSNYISVSPVGSPVANFSADPTWGSGTLTTQFIDESVQGTYPITIWSWNFGDGGSSSSQNPEHTYSSPGSYTVSLTVSDGDLSDIKTKTDYIHVYEFLTVNAGPDQALEMGLSTQLDGSYSGGSGNIEINWEGVGNNAPISNPNILNPNVGPFIDIDAYYFSLSVEDLITGETQSDEMMVDVLLGLNENLTSRIGVYPNPTNGKLWIKSEEAQSIRISDALGIEILQVKTTEETTVIDLSTYPDGVYLVQIFMKDELKIFKVIKK